MEDVYHAYLSLLGELNGDLDRLTELAQQKTDAIRNDDLIALDGVLKQEQVMSLSLRGLEQKRQKLLSQLGPEGLSLDDLFRQYPAEMQPQAKETAAALRQSYKIYRSTADTARVTLERNLHEIEKFIDKAGGVPAGVAGYVQPSAEPPKNMKTDFRA